MNNLKIRSHREVYWSIPSELFLCFAKNRESLKTKNNSLTSLFNDALDFIDNDPKSNNVNLVYNSKALLLSIEFVQHKMNFGNNFEMGDTTKIERFLLKRENIRENLEIICCHRWRIFNLKDKPYTKSAESLIDFINKQEYYAWSSHHFEKIKRFKPEPERKIDKDEATLLLKENKQLNEGKLRRRRNHVTNPLQELTNYTTIKTSL